MFSRLLRTATLIALLLSLTQGVTSPMPPTAMAQGGNVEQATKLRRLAIATGRDANRLILADESALTLHNGRRIIGLKAVDRFTGEIVSATFEGDKVIDAKSLRAESAAQWRAAHGALTPELVKKLATLIKSDERIRIAVWLAAEVNPLPKPERLPPSPEAATEFAISKGTLSTPTTKASPGATKEPAQPVPPEQVPAEIRARLQRAVLDSRRPTSTVAPKSAEAIKQKEDSLPPAVVPSPLTGEQVKVFQQRNSDTLRAQIVPVRERLLNLMQARGLPVEYASEIAPIVYLTGTRNQIEALAHLPEIDAIYDAPNIGGLELSVARSTQNADLINQVGYNGAGVNLAVVESGRIYPSNPYLTVAGACDGTGATSDHTTAVAGIIGSTHTTFRGLAPSASLYSANCSSTPTAMDWGSSNANVLNNSYWYENDGSSSAFFPGDRHLDYIVRYNYDFVTKSAGNHAAAGCPLFTPTVTSPGKGYNVMTVGNYEDNDTLGWAGDAMDACSSFGDPRGDGTTYSHAKPEVAAVGSTISSTLRSSVPATAIGPVGSGTSYAAPMVAALAADLIGANSSLSIYPESLRAIIMATALHNVEGDARLSDRDGTGAIVASAAIKTVERGQWSSQWITSTASFPKTFYVYAFKGERVRFVINWLSNPNASYTSDVLPADLDLTAYRADGTTFVQASASFGNPFEIVDFVAPESETYVFRVTAYSFTGGSTYLATASWNGTTRLPPNSGYNYGAAPPPLGEHFSVYPTDWSPTNYWRAFGIRPSSTSADYDLRLYSASWFDDPATRNLLATSLLGNGQVDLIMVDGNHRPSNQPEHHRVNTYSGTGSYAVNWSNQGIGLVNPGWYGPYSMSVYDVVRVFDVWLYGYQGKRVSIVPSTSTNDHAMELFRSDSGNSTTWTLGRGSGVAFADSYGIGSNVEALTYGLPFSAPDWLGWVVYSKVPATGDFWLYVENLNYVYLPLILK